MPAHPKPPHPESSHRWSQAAPGPFRAWGARGSGVSRDAHLTQLSLVALGTLQWEEIQTVMEPQQGAGREVGEGERKSWSQGLGTRLGSGPALLALLPWFSFRTLGGEGGKEEGEK